MRMLGKGRFWISRRCSRFSIAPIVRCLHLTFVSANKSRHDSLFQDALTILRPEWWHLSPHFGAALQSCALKGNLLGLSDSLRRSRSDNQTKRRQVDSFSSSPLIRPCQLAKSLFFQAQPGAPIRLIKTKSMVAAYLTTPQIMGTCAGLALQDQENIAQVLRQRHGIKSNHIHETEWTGVSLARWKELISLLQPLLGGVHHDSEDNNLQGVLETSLVSSIWSMAVWEQCYSLASTTKTRQYLLLEYLSAVEQVSGRDIFVKDWESIHDQLLRQADEEENQMEDSNVPPSLLLERLLDVSMDTAARGTLHSSGICDPQPAMDDATEVAARTMEALCATLASRQANQTIKPTTPNGYYGFDSGRVKPDCVEVAVREVLDFLLWDPQIGSFDLERLPKSAAPELVRFYQLQQQEYGMSEEFGKQWFDLCSNLPGCDYLSSSPHGKPYELTPTLRNMAKILQRLLYHWHPPPPENEEWNSLVELQDAWQFQDFKLSLGTHTEKAKMSPEIWIHEVATLQRRGQENAIELRLRCDWARNTGFATVTHLRVLQDEELDTATTEKLMRAIADSHPPTLHYMRVTLSIIALALLGDSGVEQQRTTSLTELVLALLSARYGIDRRQLMYITATSDLEREELAFRKAQRDSDHILKCAIHKACDFLAESNRTEAASSNRMDDPEAQLLAWLLSKTPDLESSSTESSSSGSIHRFPDRDLEETILKLPKDVLTTGSLKGQIQNHWALAGHVLTNLIDYKSGHASSWQVLGRLRLRDVPRFVRLAKQFHLR